ncbi:hypothetical protein OG440_39465 (plasmid) [Streptomyces sp. NBC_00637]|uniref:hypothetical protein n=1 Tax=Streptomyces sp. NBC_00637 TaxID=2903667 RepID=UPI002F91BC0A
MLIMLSRVGPVFWLWARVLLACALTFCLTGAARAAMTMPAPMEQAHQRDTSGQTAQAIPGPTGMEDHCPATADHASRPAAAPASAASVALGPADGPHDAVPVRPWEVRTGLSPPPVAAPPPDLNRLCVSRT